MYFCFTYSSALLVIISVEKFIASYFPLKAKSIRTVHIARQITLVTAILFVMFNAQFFYIVDIFTASFGNNVCWYIPGNPKYLRILLGVIIAILYSYGPFAIIIIVNFAIAYKFLMGKLQS